MPLAAVVEDYVFCCHGGISQWLVKRSAIRKTERPIYITETPLLRMLLATDLLWADPNHEDCSITPYIESPHHYSYLFNDSALRSALRNVDCRILIRAHEFVSNGISSIFKGKCYTVHTTNLYDPRKRPAFIVLKKNSCLQPDSEKIIIETINNPLDALNIKIEDEIFLTQLCGYFRMQFRHSPPVNFIKNDGLQKAYGLDPNMASTVFISHEALCKWIGYYAVEISKSIQEISKSYYDFKNIASFARSFPIILDIVLGDGKSFRTNLTAMEENVFHTITYTENIDTVDPDEWDEAPYHIPKPGKATASATPK